MFRCSIRDPGVEVRQSRFYDTWDVGPMTIVPGDWHYVEIPMPGYGRPLRSAIRIARPMAWSIIR